jgi:hypothetical protein
LLGFTVAITVVLFTGLEVAKVVYLTTLVGGILKALACPLILPRKKYVQ